MKHGLASVFHPWPQFRASDLFAKSRFLKGELPLSLRKTLYKVGDTFASIGFSQFPLHRGERTMRYFSAIPALGGAGILALVFTAGSRADDAEQARAIVDKAIKAMGGETQVAKFKSHTFKNKGTWYGMGDGVAYTASYAVSWPDKFRFEVEGGFMTMVLDGDKGWMQMNGETRELNKEELE